MLLAFLGGLRISVLNLRWAWSMAPLCNQPFGSTANKIICFLGIAFGVFVWTSTLLPWSYGVPVNLHGGFDHALFILILNCFLTGATPVAAFPAILLYASGKKSRSSK